MPADSGTIGRGPGFQEVHISPSLYWKSSMVHRLLSVLCITNINVSLTALM